MSEIFNWFLSNWADLIAAINGLLAALIALFLIIPGEQPEAFLGKIVGFLARFSRK